MKTKIAILATFFYLLSSSCGSSNGYVAINEPFNGSSYQGNKRFFRATASAESKDAEMAKNKAMLLAKQRLASFVQTQVNQVAETYSAERQISENLGDFNSKFQQITREVLSQTIVDLAIIGDKTYRDKKNNFICYIAIEARKKLVYERLKLLSQENNKISPAMKTAINEMINKAIEDSEKN